MQRHLEELNPHAQWALLIQLVQVQQQVSLQNIVQIYLNQSYHFCLIQLYLSHVTCNICEEEVNI